MDFAWSQEHDLMRQAISDLSSAYSEEYWREVRAEMAFPEEIYADLADGGWLGVPFSEEYGGQGMGILEFVLLIESLANAGAWVAGISLVPGPVFGGFSIQAHGTESQKERHLPKIIDGEETWALGVTEAGAGLNTSNVTTTAERDGSEFVVNGQKMFISGMDHTDRMLLLTRTTSREDADSPYDGLTMFIVDPDDAAVTYSEISMDLYYPEKPYQVQINDLRVPEEQVLGEVDEGMRHLFETLNTERIVLAAGTWGAGKHALDKAVEQAKDRVVWSDPIGAHQGIQHPLADAYVDMQTAKTAIEKAAWQYDTTTGDIGEAANVANLQAGKAAWNACEAAMTTFGGMSASEELGIAAAWGYVRHARTLPVSEEMILNYIGQQSLGLPRSY